jgi:hypothetical protein
MEDEGQVRAATQTYLYGYPLVYNMSEIAKFPAGSSPLGTKVSFNEFGYARTLLDPATKFVSPNNDTLYVLGACDLSQGPLVLHVPDTHDRYYVLQFVDAWTNNFAYVGRRASGTAEAQFLLTGGGYDDTAPDGMQVIEAPSNVFVIVGRLQVNGVEDLPAVHALQDQFTLTPCPSFKGPASRTQSRAYRLPMRGSGPTSPSGNSSESPWPRFRHPAPMRPTSRWRPASASPRPSRPLPTPTRR